MITEASKGNHFWQNWGKFDNGITLHICSLSSNAQCNNFQRDASQSTTNTDKEEKPL